MRSGWQWAVALGLLAGSAACGGGGGDTTAPPPPPPPPPPGEPGWVTFNLETPDEEGGVLLTITPPAIDSIQGMNGAETFGASRGGYWRVLVAGDLATGPLLRIHVPDVAIAATYAVRVEQVAARGPAYTPRSLSAAYRVVRGSP
jgi:hypothetical protein